MKKQSITQLKTELIPQEGIKVPVIDLSITNKEKNGLIEPEIIRKSLLELIFKPEELESLIIVKPNLNDDNLDCLKNLKFPDKIPRRVAFSSGKNIYYADAELSKKLLQPFKTQIDNACRYGSLLVSSCINGAYLLETKKNDLPLRVKIVNFTSQNQEEKKEATFYRTGDCHGKISPLLAEKLGWSQNRPLQFRFCWMNKWKEKQYHTPNISFLAKGTFLPDKELTDIEGYDLIIDRSSIKGVAKNQLNQLLPCGDYQFPQAVLGNRGNAKIQRYENSWQLSIWYSEVAINADIVTPTKIEARKLASMQNNPLKLKEYLIQQHDLKASFTNDETTNIEQDQETQSSSVMITILRHDKYGQLLDFPKIASFMRTQLAKKWRDLAVKGSLYHDSAMAQPFDNLKPGTIVASHLRHGTEVIVTRYPIVSKDNIRRYTVDNRQQPDLLKYRGCVFIRSDQAMQHHQCDFDGDQLVVTPTNKIPHIAAETRHANQENEYQLVQKRPKIDYTQAKDEKGQSQYTKLRQIAIAIAKNKIGWVATLIGRVQSSVAQPQESPDIFEKKKRKLLNQLFDALQIEVDSPKSATRLEDYHPLLLQQAKKWSEKYPSYLFDFKKDQRLYQTMPMPTEGGNPINIIARDAVNRVWQPTRLHSRHRHEFRYLFSTPEEAETKEKWEKHYLPYAQQIKERYQKAMSEIFQKHHQDNKAIKEATGKLYENLKADIAQTFPDKQSRYLAANALWYLETSNPNLHQPRKACLKLSRQLQITFQLESEHQFLHQALPKDTYILSIPFEQFSKNKAGKIICDKKHQPIGEDLASKWKESLQEKGIKYEATLHLALPMVNFALLNPSAKLIQKLEQQFGNNFNDIEQLDLTYRNHQGEIKNIGSRLVPPVDYTWLESSEDQTPKSALVLNLFTEEICQQLDSFQFNQIELIGQKYNDWQEENFNKAKWRAKKVHLEVGALNNPQDYRHGLPVVKLEGKQLAMFSTNSPKLPIGTTFIAQIVPSSKSSALILNIVPDSIQLSTVTNKTSLSEQLKQIKLNLNKSNQLASNVLHQAIKEKYHQTGKRKIRVGEWTAFINNKNQHCFVRNKNREIIFHSDLDTNQIKQHLSELNITKFQQQIMQPQTVKSVNKETEL